MDCQWVAAGADRAGSYMYTTVEVSEKFLHNNGKLYISDSITTIDLEYGGPNYLAFDIGNYFCEFAGLDVVDYGKYPNESVQKKFIKIYLEESSPLKGKDPSGVSEAAVHTLYREANKFALGSHLMWSVWGLLQVQYSTIDYNFMEYACTRFAEYQKRKEEFYNL